MRSVSRLVLGALLIALIPAIPSALGALIDENLNMASDAASFTEVALGTDHLVTWGFDYSGIVGSAPSQGDASTTGVKVVANRTLGATSAATLFHNTAVPANARVTVDLYMGVTGIGGTTEFGTVGLGSTGTTPYTIFTPIAGDGTYYTHTGDGGSSSDWRWARPGADPVGSASVPMNTTSTTYLLGSTNAPAYDGCCGLVVDPINGASTGVGGNQWVTLSIETNNGTSEITINGQTVVSGPSIGAADDTGLTGGTAPGGFASFSYADVFTSVASPGDSQFGIFDNFKVEIILDEDADFNGDTRVDGIDFLAWQQNEGLIGGALLVDGDANGDGNVDATDLGIWETQYGTGVLSAVTAVPEPSSLLLGAMASIGLILRRRCLTR